MHGARPQARRAGALERVALGERPGHDPGPRADPAHRPRRRRRRQAHRAARAPARRHGRLPPARHAGHPAARGVPLRRRVRPPAGLRLRVHVGVHDDDADRRLPRRRAPGGHVRHRAGDGRAGGEGRHRSARAAPAQLHPHGRVPVHGVERPRVRLRRPRRGGHRGRPARRLRRRPRAASRRRTSRARRSGSASACRRTSRCAASPRPGCSPR